MWPNREHLSKSCVSVPLTGPHLGLPATSSLWGPHPWCLDSPPTMCTRTFISDSCPQPVPPLAHTTHLTCIISFNSDISMRYYYYYSHFTDFRESSRIEGTGYSPFVCTFVENYLCKVWFWHLYETLLLLLPFYRFQRKFKDWRDWLQSLCLYICWELPL